jgi:hypothetical protein
MIEACLREPMRSLEGRRAVSIRTMLYGGRPAPSSESTTLPPDGLSVVPMETISIHEMVKVLQEQSATLKACGESWIQQQDQFAHVAQHV